MGRQRSLLIARSARNGPEVCRGLGVPVNGLPRLSQEGLPLVRSVTVTQARCAGLGPGHHRSPDHERGEHEVLADLQRTSRRPLILRRKLPSLKVNSVTQDRSARRNAGNDVGRSGKREKPDHVRNQEISNAFRVSALPLDHASERFRRGFSSGLVGKLHFLS